MISGAEAFFGGVAALWIGFALGHAATKEWYRTDAIERGYGLYCPVNGIFAWKGECGE